MMTLVIFSFFLIIMQLANSLPSHAHAYITYSSSLGVNDTFVMGELRCIASIKIRSFLLLCSRISKKKNTAESSIKEAASACWALEYSVWDSAFLKTAYHTFTAITAFFFFFLTVKVGQGQ